MQRKQIHVGQSLRQVQQFLVEHGVAVPSAVASAAKQALDTAVAALDQAAIGQASLTRTVRGEVQRRRQFERTLLRKYLTPLAKFARASLRETPEIAALTPSAGALARERLVRTAQAEGRRAVAALDALIGHAILGNEPLERDWRAVKRVRKPNSAGADEAAVEVAQGVLRAA